MNMRLTGLWPDEHTDMLRKLLEEGKSFAIVAAEINRTFDTLYSRSAAIGRANRLGITQNKILTETLVTHREKKPPKPRPPRPRPLPKFEPREVIELRCVAIKPRNLNVTELEAGDCRYGYGDGPFTFCGHPVEAGKSYCPDHWKLCLSPRELLHPRDRRRSA